MINDIKIWEIENKTLNRKIEEFNKEFEENHKMDFVINPFETHQKMLRTAAVLFRNEIENQITFLLKLDERVV